MLCFSSTYLISKASSTTLRATRSISLTSLTVVPPLFRWFKQNNKPRCSAPCGSRSGVNTARLHCVSPCSLSAHFFRKVPKDKIKCFRCLRQVRLRWRSVSRMSFLLGVSFHRYFAAFYFLGTAEPIRKGIERP